MPEAEKAGNQGMSRRRKILLVGLAIAFIGSMFLNWYHNRQQERWRVAKYLRSQEFGGLLDFVQADPGLRIHTLLPDTPEDGYFTLRVVADDQAARERFAAALEDHEDLYVLWEVVLPSEVRDFGDMRSIKDQGPVRQDR